MAPQVKGKSLNGTVSKEYLHDLDENINIDSGGV